MILVMFIQKLLKRAERARTCDRCGFRRIHGRICRDGESFPEGVWWGLFSALSKAA